MKKELMRYMIFALALSKKILQIELPKVEFIDIEADPSHLIRAYVNQTEYTIYCVKNWIEKVDYPELIGVLSHECRHLYQQKQLTLFDAKKPCEIDAKTADLWKQELMRKSSISKKLNDDFRWEIEADAEAYSAAIMRYCFKMEVQILPELQQIVSTKIPEFERKYQLSLYCEKKGVR